MAILLCSLKQLYKKIAPSEGNITLLRLLWSSQHEIDLLKIIIEHAVFYIE